MSRLGIYDGLKTIYMIMIYIYSLKYIFIQISSQIGHQDGQSMIHPQVNTYARKLNRTQPERHSYLGTKGQLMKQELSKVIRFF